jgi:putative aldouronate transport system permease protein
MQISKGGISGKYYFDFLMRNMENKKSSLAIFLRISLNILITAGVFVFIWSAVNSFLKLLTGRELQFFMNNNLFRGLLVFTDAWKTIGWSSIIYLAAIAGIDQELYEAAMVDGANKFQQILHITLPGLASTIIILLIMRVGNILDAGFDQIFIFYNPTVYDKADIIGTYIYRTGLGELNFSRATTVGLFNSVIGAILIFSTNILSKKWSGKSIW